MDRRESVLQTHCWELVSEGMRRYLGGEKFRDPASFLGQVAKYLENVVNGRNWEMKPTLDVGIDRLEDWRNSYRCYSDAIAKMKTHEEPEWYLKQVRKLQKGKKLREYNVEKLDEFFRSLWKVTDRETAIGLAVINGRA